jgi:LytR cell envelope-related transcriptional attenuator
MAKKTDGYRARRLAQRRNQRSRVAQNVALYALAAVVAFGAVLGAVRVAHALRTHHTPPHGASYLALVTVGEGEKGRQPVTALMVHDFARGTLTVFTVPRDLLLTSASGGYVMAADALSQHELQSYMERLVTGPISYRLRLSYGDLTRLSGGGDLWVQAAAPFGLHVDDAIHSYSGRFSLPAAMLPAVLSADGKAGPDQAGAELAFVGAVLKGAALAPQNERASAIDAIAKEQSGLSAADARDLLAALVSSRTIVAQIPSTGRTAEGQFAWRPDPEAITAQITRNARGFNAPFTVVVENGSGVVGIGEQAIGRLAGMDVNLPPVRNADSFDYQSTQILAGSRAFGVAAQVRGILRRGVVLNGAGLSPTTVVVIIGKDLKPKDLQ